ncbi:trypsin-like peptidase domain-containing protein [Georgenia satyanarayanai]|nr:trypsin-like peptidase domain-containing protein [Georgenia satyanarayanai]
MSAYVPAPGAHRPGPAVARLFDGSATIVSRDHALTALHVVPDEGRAELLKLFLSDGRCVHGRLAADDGHDLALIDLVDVPEDFDALPALALVPDVDPETAIRVYGWGMWRPSEHDLDVVTATVSDVVTLHGRPVLRLFSPESAAGKNMHGFSGGPAILVSPRGTVGPPTVAGIVYWMPTNEEVGNAGVLYAIPASVAIELWPVLRAAAMPALPSAGPIGAYLRDHVGTGDRHIPFGGRSALLTELHDAVLDPSGPAGHIIVAPAGRGKSMLLARLADRLMKSASADVVVVPVAIRYGLAREEVVLRALVGRLAHARGHDVKTALDCPPAELRDRVVDLLTGRGEPGRRLVLIIDGLDEAQGWDVAPGMFPLSPYAVLVVSARSTSDRPDPAGWLSTLGWDPRSVSEHTLAPFRTRDVREVLGDIQPPLESAEHDEATRGIAALAGGDPLSVALYARDLQHAPDRARWLRMVLTMPGPPGLEGYLDRWWRDQELLWGGPLGARQKVVRRVLDLLAVAFAPLSRRQLLDLARLFGPIDGDDLDVALDDLRRWIIVTRSGLTYALAHERLAEVRRARLSDDGDLTAYDEGVIAFARGAIGEQVHALDAYLGVHLTEHLRRADAPTAHWTVLLDPRYAAVSSTDSMSRQTSLRELAQRIDADHERALSAGQPLQWTRERLACSAELLATASAEKLPQPELVARLIDHGVWTTGDLRRYLDLAATGEEAPAREAVMGEMLPILGIRRGLELAHSVGVELAEPEQRLGRLVRHVAALGAADIEAAVRNATAVGVSRLLAIDLDPTADDSDLVWRALCQADASSLSLLATHFSAGSVSRVVGKSVPKVIDAVIGYARLGGEEARPGQLSRVLATANWAGEWLTSFATIRRIAEVARTGAELTERAGALSDAIMRLRIEKEAAIDSQDFETAADRRDEEIQALQEYATLRESVMGLPAREGWRLAVIARLLTGPPGSPIMLDPASTEDMWGYATLPRALRRAALQILWRARQVPVAAALVTDPAHEPDELLDRHLFPMTADCVRDIVTAALEQGATIPPRTRDIVLSARASLGPDDAAVVAGLRFGTSQAAGRGARDSDDAVALLGAAAHAPRTLAELWDLMTAVQSDWLRVELVLCLASGVEDAPRSIAADVVTALVRAAHVHPCGASALDLAITWYRQSGGELDDLRVEIHDDALYAHVLSSLPPANWDGLNSRELLSARRAMQGNVKEWLARYAFEYPRMTAEVLKRLDQESRAAVLDGILRAAEWTDARGANDAGGFITPAWPGETTFASRRTWSRLAAFLVAGMKEEELAVVTTVAGARRTYTHHGLRVFADDPLYPHDGPVRDRLFASVASRLGALERWGSAANVLGAVSGVREAAATFGWLIDRCPATTLPEIVRRALLTADDSGSAASRAALWLHILRRQSVLTERQQRRVLQTVLAVSPHSVESLAIDRAAVEHFLSHMDRASEG